MKFLRISWCDIRHDQLRLPQRVNYSPTSNFNLSSAAAAWPFEALDTGKPCSSGADLEKGLLAEVQKRGNPQKVSHAESRCETRRPPSGHDVAGSGHVVAQHLAGVFANENTACRSDRTAIVLGRFD